MKTNNNNRIKFKMNYNDRLVEIEGNIESDGSISRMGKPIYHNCMNEGVKLHYNEFTGNVYCNECGEESVEVSTFEDLNQEEMENIHLKYFGTDEITLQDLYKLSYTLPYDMWTLVSDYFMRALPKGDYGYHLTVTVSFANTPFCEYT